MNQTQLVKRAFNITVRYPVLWLFGILLALTSGGGGGGGGTGYQFGGGGERSPTGIPPIPGIEHFDPRNLLWIIGLCCCLLLILAVVATIARYVAWTALYRMVDHLEETGASPTWREGFRLGWSNRAFRLFLLNLIVGILFFLAILLLLALAASPLLLLLVHNNIIRGVGIGITVGLALLAILILIVAGVVLSILGQFWSREIVLADRSIGQALVAGYDLVRRRLKDVGLMWLLMFAIGFGYGLVMIPTAIAVVLGALLAGGGLGYGIYAATHSVVWAVIAGLPVFLIITIVPLTILQGLYLVFESSAWTLTYREAVRGTAARPTEGSTAAPALA